MKKTTKKILGYICIMPLVSSLLYGLYKAVLLAIEKPSPILGTLCVFGIFGLFTFGVLLLDN